MAINKNFVIKNGLEVNTDLIFADTDSNKVGIATINPYYNLHVFGGIGATALNVTGISTVNNLVIDGRVTAGSSLGASGQYLVSTGNGVVWYTPPVTRSTDVQIAGIGATTFNTSYTVGLLDVYVNGVKLSGSEFIANNGATVILNDACFGEETIEFVSYGTGSISAGSTGIAGLTILEEGTPVGSALQVTSINFVGAAVTAVGSGLGVTVYISDNDTINPNYWESTVAGINTLSNVGIGTTNPGYYLEIGPIGYANTALWVNGNARVTGILTVGSSSIILDGANNSINVGSGVTIDGNTGIINASSLEINGETLAGAGVTFITSGSGISIDQSTGNVTITATANSSQWETTDVGINTLSSVGIGTTDPTSKLTVTGDGYFTGVVTATSFVGDGSQLTGIVESQWETNSAGIHTLSNVGIGTTDPTSALSVSGDVNVTGIVTATGGFISIGNTTPIQISLVENQLIFTAIGIGSTAFTLF